jgi:hypothetical protein
LPSTDAPLRHLGSAATSFHSGLADQFREMIMRSTSLRVCRTGQFIQQSRSLAFTPPSIIRPELVCLSIEPFG